MDPVDDTGFGYTDDFVLCLLCEYAAYDDNISPENFHRVVDNNLEDKRARSTATPNPLRKSDVDMNPICSIQPWLVSADDDRLSDAINNQRPIGTRTLSKPGLHSEHQGPGKITAAALHIFG